MSAPGQRFVTVKNITSSIHSPNPIEEPSVPEIKMKSSSWYEPERDRIIVTDLDSSSDEEIETNEADNLSVSISPALLEKISSRSREFIGSSLPPPASSQALVLFKPLPVAGMLDLTRSSKEEVHVPRQDDDAMDIELD